MATISEHMQNRANLTIADRPEHEALLERYTQALVGPDTPENLREMTACWARSEFLWNRKPAVTPPPPGFGPGNAAAGREGARLAA